MTAALVLLAYAACAGTVGARVLARARWTTRAPLLGMLTYLAAGWSAVAAVGLAGVTLAVHAHVISGDLSQVIGACVRRLRALYAAPGGATVTEIGLILAGAVLARTVVTTFGQLRTGGRQALQHAHTARLTGHVEPTLGAVVLDHPQPAAYCVAGRCPTVVVTTGAVAALAPGQLDAVLAHERAHLAGRHHTLKAAARIGRHVLPFLPLLRDAEAQVARLAELHADDSAARIADRRQLATALVVLATPASSTPPPALAAAATDVMQRLHRLLRPAEPLTGLRRHLVRATAVTLAMAPVLVASTPAVAALLLGRLPAA